MFNYFDKEKIEAEFPDAYMIPPMLAWKLPKNKQEKAKEVMSNGEYFAEVKIDGSCYVFEYTPKGNTYLFSRTVSVKNGLLVNKADRVPHLIESLKTIFKPGTAIALELFKHGGKSKDVTSITGCLAAKAVERQEKQGKLQAYLHDILVLDNKSLLDYNAIDRIEILSHLVPLDAKHILLAEPIMTNIENYLTTVWQEGYEGIILKKMDSKYHPSKRPAWSWIKFKPEDSHDVVAISFNPPNKNYTGKELETWGYWEDNLPVTKSYNNRWIGSINMGVYKGDKLIHIGSVSSGLTESILEQIKKAPENFIGKPMEVKAMETTTDFKLREPKFIKFREDLNIKDCNFDKIFA